MATPRSSELVKAGFNVGGTGANFEANTRRLSKNALTGILVLIVVTICVVVLITAVVQLLRTDTTNAGQLAWLIAAIGGLVLSVPAAYLGIAMVERYRCETRRRYAQYWD